MLEIKLNYQVGNFSLGVDCQIANDRVTAIHGASGSGKTTLLRCLAGLMKAEGRICFNDRIWQDEEIFVPPHHRRVGYVFQEPGLFPHLTCQGNLDYALKRAAGEDNEAQISREELLDILGIRDLLSRYPDQCSGGERQRVAIARAVLSNPQILLMDEPLSAVDVSRKQELLPYLQNLTRQLTLPVIYVSHAIDEIARLADDVVILGNGMIEAQGPLDEVFSGSQAPGLIDEGPGVILEATIVERDSTWDLLRARSKAGDLWLYHDDLQVGDSIRIRVLARDISLASGLHDDTSILNKLPATVTEVINTEDRATCLVRLQVGESMLLAGLTRRSVASLNLMPGRDIWAQIKAVAIVA